MTASRMSQEEAMKPQKTRQRVLPARKRLSECRSVQFYLMKRGFKGLHSLLMIYSGPEPQLAFIQL